MYRGQLRYFCHFLISRWDGENNGFLAGVPLLPPPSPAVSRPNSLPLPFRTPATQAIQKPLSEIRLFDAGFTDHTIAALYVIPFKVTKNIKLSMF